MILCMAAETRARTAAAGKSGSSGGSRVTAIPSPSTGVMYSCIGSIEGSSSGSFVMASPRPTIGVTYTVFSICVSVMIVSSQLDRRLTCQIRRFKSSSTSGVIPPGSGIVMRK